MTLSESIRTCFTKYADFTGRASRSEFWWWFLFTFLTSAALSVVSDKLSAVFSIATLLPAIAVAARRLHDTDHSGWWQLLWFLPIIGWIVLLVWWVQEGKASARFDRPS
ncbi:uncharacterized membrane protein YhaH (DUF805 family) [Janthinobacterium sp. CG_23.3]|uniref:DUF805 domain-containing protein n=1 Tax=unclassified Janthinobacterium TaxID=2610881 RepID=UPI000346E325|nr:MULTISPECIES: DUF805 domain-containing protein [unclassified Janthinobacterium]MEC5160793.1 uncharacterized membrane protein YhaH (DUF805 family) [Janthinobacterium sp. CG_S6]